MSALTTFAMMTMLCLPTEALIKKKAKADALDKANMSPLHLAAQRGAAAVIPPLAAAAGQCVHTWLHTRLALWLACQF
jgi:hypothetical protein